MLGLKLNRVSKRGHCANIDLCRQITSLGYSELSIFFCKMNVNNECLFKATEVPIANHWELICFSFQLFELCINKQERRKKSTLVVISVSGLPRPRLTLKAKGRYMIDQCTMGRKRVVSDLVRLQNGKLMACFNSTRLNDAYCIVLYCVVYCVVLCCVVLRCVALRCVALRCVALRRIVSFIMSCHVIYRIVSYHIISYHIISYHIISYHIISYHIIITYFTLHHITLHNITLHYMMAYNMY